MKKTTFLYLLTLLCFLTLGVLSIVSYMQRKDLSNNNIAVNETVRVDKQFSILDNSNISLDISKAIIDIGVSPDNTVHITYYDAYSYTYEIEQSDDELELKQIVLDQNYFSKSESTDVFLLIPAQFTGMLTIESEFADIDIDTVSVKSIDVSTDFGNIKVEKISSREEITLSTDFGNIDLRDINLVSPLYVNTDFGNIKAEKISSQEDIRLDTDFGSIDLRDVNLANESNLYINSDFGELYLDTVFANSIDIIADFGRINVEQIVCTDINVEGTSGDIKFTDLDAQNITIAIRKPSGSRSDDEGGDVRGSIIGKQSDFSVTSHTDSGSNNLSNQAGSENKTLNVSTYLGNIDISFTE